LIFRIQYVRHLHDKVAAIEVRTAPKKEDQTPDTHVMDGGLMGLGSTLMIGNAPYGKQNNIYLYLS
jgi:hypothetical protein